MSPSSPPFQFGCAESAMQQRHKRPLKPRDTLPNDVVPHPENVQEQCGSSVREGFSFFHATPEKRTGLSRGALLKVPHQGTSPRELRRHYYPQPAT